MGPAAPALSPTEPVRVREVPFDRIQATLTALTEQAAKSDTYPDEWAKDKKDAANAELLRGLQISEDPATIRVLGRSEFTTTDRVRPEDGTLEKFARKIGATTVVWSSAYRGKADIIVDHPVTEWRTSSWGSRRGRGVPFSETYTIWVPVRMSADQYAFVAFFLANK